MSFTAEAQLLTNLRAALRVVGGGRGKTALRSPLLVTTLCDEAAFQGMQGRVPRYV